METILGYIKDYGYETLFIAIAINILTAILKSPIKKLAAKSKDGTLITKYITFLPLIIGFGLCAFYKYVFLEKVSINGDYISLWLSSASLSLAIYAVFEKFFPSKQKVLEEYELKQNLELIEKLKIINENSNLTIESAISTASQVINQDIEKTEDINIEQNKNIDSNQKIKIILRGNGNAETNTK